MGNGGEELYLGVSNLQFLFLVQLFHLRLMPPALPRQCITEGIYDKGNDYYYIKNLGRQTPIERWIDHNLQHSLLCTPYAVVVGALHPELVCSRRKVGICSRGVVTRHNPLSVKTFEDV